MRKRRWRKRKEKKQQRLGYRGKVKGKSDRCPGKRSDSRERRRSKGWRQTLKRKNERERVEGQVEGVVGAEKQKVRGRGVLMAVCRAGLEGTRGLVGAEEQQGWWMVSVGIDRKGGEGSVVSSWPLPLPLIRVAQVC